jgi:AcrR family transcriptional regulator
MNDRSVSSPHSRRHSAKRRAAPDPLLPPELAAEGPRRRILQAALSLFAQRGFHGSSIREIVQQVQMQGSAVYAHFASKEHILAELARAGHETHMHALQAALLECGTDPVEQLRGHVRANAIFHVQYPHIAKVVNAEMGALSPELLAPALALRTQSAQLLFQILERGARSGRFELVYSGDDPAAAARALYATAGALGAMALRLPYWFPTDDSFDPEELAQRHVDIALRIVGAKVTA